MGLFDSLKKKGFTELDNIKQSITGKANSEINAIKQTIAEKTNSLNIFSKEKEDSKVTTYQIENFQNYVVFDLETSCLNSKVAEIIEISALKVVSGNVTEEFSSLIKPCGKLDPKATEINKITSKMLKDAPSALAVLSQFQKFITGFTLVGYNIATYDLPILRRYFNELLKTDINNDYIDVLPMAQQRIPAIPNYKLSTIASYFCINASGAHRALADCLITKQCFEKLQELPILEKNSRRSPRKFHTELNDKTKALQELQAFLLGILSDNKLEENEILALKEWLNSHSALAGNYPFDRVFQSIEQVLEDGYISQDELDNLLVLFTKCISPTEESTCDASNIDFNDKIICLTGDFRFGSKADVEQVLISKGAICKSSVTKKTSYVIVGGCGSADWSCGNYGSKVKRAMELQEQGIEIQIIREDNLRCLKKGIGLRLFTK